MKNKTAILLPGCISNWGQIGRLQVAATIAKSTCVDYAPKLKCTPCCRKMAVIQNSRFTYDLTVRQSDLKFARNPARMGTPARQYAKRGVRVERRTAGTVAADLHGGINQSL